jgi:uncharacterized protein YndB with AHSA1/START domain
MSTKLKPSTARAVTDGEIVLATVDVAGPPERAFQALNTDETERWWGSADTYRMEDWTSDIRVGGCWRVGIRFLNNPVVWASGEFLEIDAPRKTVLTRVYEFDHPTLGRRSTTVTYLCDPIETGTRVTVRHEGFGNSQAAAEHAFGWERALDWFAEYLDDERGPA